MNLLTLIAVGIVIAGVTLIVACALSMMLAPLPQASRSAREPAAVSLQLWCPVTHRIARVGVAATKAQRLVVVACDRFPDGAIACERDCVPVPQAA